ncbi:MAG: dTDP-glucose 4,6-dehydratase [Acidobacteria bacterium]|nr:dTDP-glucose 4,6-dehydratase [Acidobacteriota bacterium]
MKLLVTGGAGFIGSEFVRLAVGEGHQVLNLDKLTYAGNLENLEPVRDQPGHRFVRGDICDAALVDALLTESRPDAIVHFAAESHVDRSILSPQPFVDTNVKGTFTLLEAARARRLDRFLHVSTDEVYGSLEPPIEADEDSPLRPSSPYAASKAGADLLALSYFATYRLPVLVTRASNNYGPYQFPEKLVPLMITNALAGRPLPVYGDGRQVRDWLYVEDHCQALLALLEKGRDGEIYNIGGNCALENLEVVRRILASAGRGQELIEHVTDRPGHDRRYALSSAKLLRETGWEPRVGFEAGLERTIAWYRANRGWVEHVRSGEYLGYYERNYSCREVELARLAGPSTP